MSRPRQRLTNTTGANTNSSKVSTMTTTATSQIPKAKNPANQEALERLHHLAQNATTPYYLLNLQRAMKAVRFCPHALTTIDQAVQLKYVGERMARIIVPISTSSSTVTTPMTTTQQHHKQQEDPPPRQSRASKTTLAAKTATASITATSGGGGGGGDATQKDTDMAYSNSSKQQAYSMAKHHAETLQLPRGPWKVWLLVDIREHRSQTVVSRCQQAGIPCQERVLPIGDMTWIAQCDDIEIILGTILERKQVADLVGSLFGTRFLEQRLRLKHCGVPQVLYLVEGDLTSAYNCPADTLRMAMMETRIQSDFQVLQTKHLDDTVRLLKGLHRRIIQRSFPSSLDELPTFVGRNSIGRGRGKTSGNGKKQRRPLSLLELVFDTTPIPALGQTRFTTFGELKAKIEFDREVGTQTVGAIYQAMLKQVPTLSQKKCQAIAALYPTWSHLLSDPDRKLASIPCGRQTVGPKSAAEIELVCRLRSDGTMIQQQPLKETEPSALTTATAITSTIAPPAAAGGGVANMSSEVATSHECLDLTQDSPAPARADEQRSRWNQNLQQDELRRSLEFPLSTEQDDENIDRCQSFRQQSEGQGEQTLVHSHKQAAIDPVQPSSDAQHDVVHSKRKYANDSTFVGCHSSPSNESDVLICSESQKQSVDTSIDLSLSSDDETSPFKKHRVALPSEASQDNAREAVSKPLSISFFSDDESTLAVTTNRTMDQSREDLDRKPSSNDRGKDAEENGTFPKSPDIPKGNKYVRESFGGDSSVWFTSPSTSCSMTPPIEPPANPRYGNSHHDVSIVVIDSSSDDDDEGAQLGQGDLRSRLTKRAEPETIVID